MDFVPFIKVITVISGLMILPGILLVACVRGTFENAIGLGTLWGFGITSYLWTTTAILWRYDFGVLAGETALLWALSLWMLFRKRLNVRPIKYEFSLDGTLLIIAALLLFLGPLTVLYLPLDTDAQGFGLQALTTQKGGTVDTLAPLYPELRSLYPPAYFVIVAFLSEFTAESIPEVMLVFSHLTAALAVIAAMAAGRLLHSEWFGLLFGLCFIIGLGLFTALMDAHYTMVLATLFLIGLLGFFIPTIERFSWKGLLSAAFFLGLLVYCHPDTLIAFLIAFIPFFFLAWLSREHLSWWPFLLVMLGSSTLGSVFAFPWLVKNFSYLWSPGIVANLKAADFSHSLAHWTSLVFYQGGLVCILGLLGAMGEFRRRTLIGLFALIWLMGIIDFALLGTASKILGSIGVDVTLHFYPFGLSWNGAIVPLAILGALFILVFEEKQVRVAVRTLLICLTALLSAGIIFGTKIIEFSKKYDIPIYGAFSTRADMDAFEWIKQNSSDNVTVLNYPGYIGHWLPVICNRRAVNFRTQPWFLYSGEYGHGEDISGGLLSRFYLNPDGQGFHDALKRYGVKYVVVPEMWQKAYQKDLRGNYTICVQGNNECGEKSSVEPIWRFPEIRKPIAELGKKGFLKVVFEKQGARVFAVE